MTSRPAWLLALLLLTGCSLTSGQSSRPVPLPENVDPEDLSSVSPESIPKLTPDQIMYLNAMDPPKRQNYAKSISPINPSRQLAPPTLNKKLKSDRGPDGTTTEGPTDNQYQAGSKSYDKVTDDFRNGKITPEQYQKIQYKAWAAYQMQLDREIAAQLPKPSANKHILTLSGGVAHGAWQAGVLCGWTAAGSRPVFDVVTGVSTGALIAPMAFLGAEYDEDLKRFYTTTVKSDVFRVKLFPPLGLGTDSITTNKPLRSLVESLILKPGVVEQIAAEHMKGRRLYVGTTNLDTMRFVTWDLGAIACQGTCESKHLIVDLLLAASAMPPLMTPTRITVNIDGKCYEEMHVDGGTTRNVFIYPPSDWVGAQQDPNSRLLAGANVYCIVGGKVHGDPVGVKPKVVAEGLRAISTVLSSSQRAELFRLHAYCISFDMKFHLSAIPPDYALFNSSDFDPEKMTKLFNTAYCSVCNGKAWDQGDLHTELGEVIARRGTCLTSSETKERGTFEPAPQPGQPGTGPLP